MIPDPVTIKYRRNTVRTLYYLYYILGGFYFSSTVHPAWRYFWYGYNSIMLVYTNCIGLYGYLRTSTYIEPTALIHVVTEMCISSNLLIFQAILIFYFRKNIETFLQNADIYLGSPKPQHRPGDIEYKSYNTISIGKKWIISISIFAGIFVALNPTYVFVICGKICVNNQVYYGLPTPYVEQIKTYTNYLLVVLFQTSISVSTVAVGVSSMALNQMIGCEFYNAYGNLCLHIQHMIDNTISDLKQYQMDLVEKKKDLLEDKIFVKFKTDIKNTVKRYRTTNQLVH